MTEHSAEHGPNFDGLEAYSGLLSTSLRSEDRDLHIRELDLAVEEKVERYLRATENTFEIGEPNYFARLALSQALDSFREGNYGIGAVAVLVKDGMAYEFPGRNAMITGVAIHDHAETRALEDMGRYNIEILEGRDLCEQEKARTLLVEPARSYSIDLNEHTEKLPEGLHVYGTLEPCPMCMCTLINAGATTSISSVLDGNIDSNGVSDGGASVIGKKIEQVPQVWRMIREGLGLEFELLSTFDRDLQALSADIFLDTREEIDAILVARKKNAN